ncbi:MAG: IS630 family transposase [Anaerolineae bacterium]|nr:MAG: IS630 family transposase [Anaerolineae bacterium]
MKKRYVVRLAQEEREWLKELVSKGKAAAYKIKHANILLMVDADGPGWTDQQAAEAFSCHMNTVARIRQRFVEEGLEAALERKKRRYKPRVVDGEVEARLIALWYSAPPKGHARWTLRLLADQAVEREIVPAISHETVRQVLKKNDLKPHLKEYFVIPPEQDAAFVAHMEDILALYQRPYEAQSPVICMDEQPKQLIAETRLPLPAEPGQPQRFDYEYERKGTANLFLFTEPLAGWRRVAVRERRTAVDWAEEIQHLLEHDYPHEKKVILVCDNLNTHTIASLYKRFPPAQARALAERLEIHYTPKHGSWLNIAESELAALPQQCLNRRIPNMETLRQETAAWYQERSRAQKAVDWQFTTQDARTRLKRLYPQIET